MRSSASVKVGDFGLDKPGNLLQMVRRTNFEKVTNSVVSFCKGRKWLFLRHLCRDVPSGVVLGGFTRRTRWIHDGAGIRGLRGRRDARVTKSLGGRRDARVTKTPGKTSLEITAGDWERTDIRGRGR